MTRDRDQSGYEAWALNLLAEIATRRGFAGVESADYLFRRSMALAETLGMRPLLAHCHAGLAGVCTRSGQAGGADDH